jgi:CO/xanthine dehydrogenase Mo-binding subunit
MQNASYLDYRMPTALDVPVIETIIVEVPNPLHPYGVRGVGETPIVAPPGLPGWRWRSRTQHPTPRHR